MYLLLILHRARPPHMIAKLAIYLDEGPDSYW